MKVKTIIPAADVRPDEPRWWCVDHGQAVTDLAYEIDSADDLHTDPPDGMPSTPMWAIVYREPVEPARDDSRERLWSMVYASISVLGGSADHVAVEADLAVSLFDERFRKEAP